MLLKTENLTETHPELPGGWRRTIGMLQAQGWPWNCEVCGQTSYLVYRCSRCGADLA